MLFSIKIEPSYVTQQDDATEAYAACIFQGPCYGGAFERFFWWERFVEE